MNRIMNLRRSEYLIAGLFFSGCFLFFFLFYRYHLYFTEQLRIFLLTPSYAFSYLNKPAFLSSLAGDFFTQFYYLTGGGAVVITLILFALWLAVRRMIIISGNRQPGILLPLLPSIITWIALTDLEYPLAAVMSLIISVICTLIYFPVRNNILRLLTALLLLTLVYFTAGSGFYITAGLLIFFELSRKNIRQSIFPIILVLCVTGLIPLLTRTLFHITLLQAFTWISDGKDNPRFLHYLPAISILLSVVLSSSFFAGIIRTRITQVRLDAMNGIGILVFLVAGLAVSSDFTLEKILRLDYKASHERWQEVFDLSKKFNLRNNLASYYTNLALGKLGLLPEKLLEFYQPAATGLFIPVNANENYVTITFSNEVYWQLGDINASQHSALLGMIFSPQSRNVRLLKRLAEINIANSQYDVAGKYLRILEKTLYHRKWALQMERFLSNEEECSRSPWISAKRKIIPVRDILKQTSDYKMTLTMLASDHPENSLAVDYLLCYDLLSKDLLSFMTDFRKYYRPAPGSLLPEVYQEAILMQIASGKYTPADFTGYRFSPDNIRRIAEYAKIYEQNMGNGASLKKEFGTTYWFYYHYAVMKQD